MFRADSSRTGCVTNLLSRFWSALRAVSGDDAYERYVAHWRAHHATTGPVPLDRAAFFEQEQRRRWEGINRCC
jgi:uncharacterized short protein YbdD (DUF466 family)